MHKLAQKITQDGTAPLPSSWLCSEMQDREMDSQWKTPYNHRSGLTWLHNITLNTNSRAANSSSSNSRSKHCKAKKQRIAGHAKVKKVIYDQWTMPNLTKIPSFRFVWWYTVCGNSPILWCLIEKSSKLYIETLTLTRVTSLMLN